jgi:hypothetical protein
VWVVVPGRVLARAWFLCVEKVVVGEAAELPQTGGYDCGSRQNGCGSHGSGDDSQPGHSQTRLNRGHGQRTQPAGPCAVFG